MFPTEGNTVWGRLESGGGKDLDDVARDLIPALQ